MSSGEFAPKTAALALAERAHALVQDNPRAAAAQAERALASARLIRDAEAQVAALFALAWAQELIGDPRAAATLRLGLRIGQRHGDRRGVGLLRRHRALNLAFAGRHRAARREIEAAMGLLTGHDRARSQVQRIAIHRAAPSPDPEVHRRVRADAARALRVLRRDGDAIWESRLLFNRGLLFLDRGELDAAEADLRQALRIRKRLSLERGVANAVVELASIDLLRGDVIGCLQTLDEVAESVQRGEAHHALLGWRASALGRAHLVPEARSAAEAYIDLCHRTRYDDYAVGTLLELAELALVSGDLETASRLAATARRSFVARGKPVNAALAQATYVRTQLFRGELRRSSLRSSLAAVAVLERAGWRQDALRLRLLVAQVALALGSPAIAREQLVRASRLRRTGTARDRINVFHVSALLAASNGDGARARSLLTRGLRLLEDYRAVFGAIELRATASGIGAELSEFGLRLAVESGDTRKILMWAERLRANALRLPTIRPPHDSTLARLGIELRWLVERRRVDGERGRPTAALAARQSRVESAIRARTRRLRGRRASLPDLPLLPELRSVIGDRSAVEYIELDGEYAALTLAAGRLKFLKLGPAGVGTELEWLRFALGRLARGRVDAQQRRVLAAGASAAATALDRGLVGPLQSELGTASALVIVPTGLLHSLPWAALPSLAGRPLVVAPSLSTWRELGARTEASSGRITLVGGPRLRHAAAEVRALGSLYPGATVLDGASATSERVLAALDGAWLAHLACHGHFRGDSPLFSSLELADGPLNVYELQRLRRAPEIVVLSACDLGVSRLHPGNELVGLSSALLGIGTRTIVASVVPVPDAAVRRLMLAFHTNLLAGVGPAAALAHAQVGTRVAGFLCLGSE